MTAPPIIDAAGDLLSRYKVLFCDVWGVVHDGRTAYQLGCAALTRFRESGGTVILVTNAPRTPQVVAEMLVNRDVPRDCYDAIVSSGGIALRQAMARGFRNVHHIGPDRDLDVFDGSRLERVAIDKADAIFCTGLIDDRNESGEDYRGRLADSARRGRHLICANPDLVVHTRGELLPCAGAIATVYEDLGGPVIWSGKPHKTAYDSALEHAAELRGQMIDKSDILAIGDAVRTDIAGAVQYGIEALFIGQGIHRETVMPDGRIDQAELARLFADDAPRAVAAMETLAW